MVSRQLLSTSCIEIPFKSIAFVWSAFEKVSNMCSWSTFEIVSNAFSKSKKFNPYSVKPSPLPYTGIIPIFSFVLFI